VRYFKTILSILFINLILFTNPVKAENWLLKPLPDSVEVFMDDLIKHSGSEIDKKIATLKKELETAPVDSQQGVKDQIKELSDARNNPQLLEIGTKLYENTQKVLNAVKNLSEEWDNNVYSLKPTSFLPEEINLNELKTYNNTALKGDNYDKKISDLNSKLKAINTQGYSAETTKLPEALNGLEMAMSEWGEKVSGIGTFIKGYGDITVGFMDAVQKLNKTVADNISQSCIGNGVRSDSDNMNQAWNEQELAGITACRENGLANVYVNMENPSELYLWDPLAEREVGPEKNNKPGGWWLISEIAPGLTLKNLKERYETIFKKSGGKNKNPSADQILHEYQKTIELKLTAENIGAIPERN